MPRPNRKKRNPSTVDAKPFAFQKITDPITGDTIVKRLVSPQITDEIMSTGNPTVLEKFYNDNEGTLTAADKQYLNAKLHTAKKVEKLRKNALIKLSKGEDPYKESRTEVTYAPAKNEYSHPEPLSCSLPDLKGSGRQTSNNGCWSYAMSLMLKSKGIHMSQEEIRAYRPNIKPGAHSDRLVNDKLMRDEQDTINNIYENADLIMEVLPNHYIEQYSIYPFNPEIEYTSNKLDELKNKQHESVKAQQDYVNAEKKLQEDAKKHFVKRSKEIIENIIMDTIIKEQSPVVMNLHGSHYITITGYDKTTGVLTIEDSQQKVGETHVKRRLDDIINENIAQAEGLGYGISLTALKRIPVSEYSDRSKIERKYRIWSYEGVVEDIKGDKLDENNEFVKGHTIGISTNDMKTYNYRNIYTGKNRDIEVSVKNNNDAPWIYSVERYYPKKVIFKNDPNLGTAEQIKQKFNTENEQIYTALEQKQNNAVNNANPVNAGANNVNNEAADDGAAPLIDFAPPVVHHEIQAARGSFGEFINICKNKIKKQTEGNFPALASLYAVNKYIEQQHIDTNTLGTRVMTQQDNEAIAAMIKKYKPLLASYQGEKDLLNTKDMNCIAVYGTAEELSNCVDAYCMRIIPSESPFQTLEEKAHVNSEINSALQIMTGPGTGVNYFGSRRSSNTNKYDRLIQSIQRYQQSEVKDPFDTFNLKKQCLDYISDKYTVRSTPSGRIRFNQTMRILKNIMCNREFNNLVNDINKKREVYGNPSHENYLTSNSFSKQTGDDILNNFYNGLFSEKAPGEVELKRTLAVIIAVNELTKGSRFATVIDPSKPEDQTAAFNRKVKEVQSSAAFKRLEKSVFASPFEEGVMQYTGDKLLPLFEDSGVNVTARFNNIKNQLSAGKKGIRK